MTEPLTELMQAHQPDWLFAQSPQRYGDHRQALAHAWLDLDLLQPRALDASLDLLQPRTLGATEHVNLGIDTHTWRFVASALRGLVPLSEERFDEPYERNEKGGVVFTESKMETGRPYPFKIADTWIVAVKREDKGDVRLYQLV